MPVVAWFALGAVPLAIIGGVLFATAPLGALKRVIGAFLLLMVVWRHLPGAAVWRPSAPAFAWLGALFSFISALTGSVGPLMAPFFLAYGLVKGSYIGTEALATVVMHVVKLGAYVPLRGHWPVPVTGQLRHPLSASDHEDPGGRERRRGRRGAARSVEPALRSPASHLAAGVRGAATPLL